MFKSFKGQSIFSLILILTLLVIPISSSSADNGPQIKAMTRNLYLGADIFKVVEAAQENPDDPLAVPIAVSELYHTMLFTNFWARAEAIADEIEEKNPDVIGLQEVSKYFKQTPSDFINGGTESASFVVIDFYQVLNDALLDRGLHYKEFEQENADIELPMLDLKSPNFFSDVRMVDRDMVLVKDDGYNPQEVLTKNYEDNLSINLSGMDLTFNRGFLIYDVTIKGEDFRFVNTHLEVRGEPGSPFRLYQFAQMYELLTLLANPTIHLGVEEKPIIMVGDFNSSPEDVPGTAILPDGSEDDYTPPYMLAEKFGYLDAWTAQNKYDEGYTSGFDEYVSDPCAELTSRIDLIFLAPENLVDKVKCDVVGDEVSDMVPNPLLPEVLRLWPSDHAGVVGEIRYKK
ncbi:MAG: endonuclease/exonuclease/phosphatase family protein [Desulfobacterales bacterium]